jgi:H+/Cl- antiporter ClcA
VDVWLVCYIGVFLGALCRLVLPYLRKARENPELKFEWKFLVTFAISVVFALIAASVIFAGYTIPETMTPQVFFVAFLTGWSSTDILNEIISTRTAGE